MGIFDKAIKAVKDIASEENIEKVKDLAGKAGDKIKETYEDITSEENKEKVKNFAEKVSEKVHDTVEDITSEENKEKIKSFAEKIGDKLTDTKEALEQKLEQKSSSQIPGSSLAKEKILKVLEEEFEEYTVKEDVSPKTIGGEGKFMNYSLGIYKEDEPVLFIMIIGKTTCSHREYRFSKEEAERNGIQMINFIAHYPNEISYITQRLHQYL